tara:strand:- start:966 stop:1478 length:513 start_codon:yes stop_codon:yes gene_type:complete
MLKKSVLWNIVIFNTNWFGLIFIGNLFIPVAVILLSIQFRYLKTPKNELLLVCLVSAIGILLDLALVYGGVFIFPDSTGIPLWLMVLWFCFASTIRHSLAFLANSKVLQFIVGGLFAPLSYLAGSNFAVVTLTPSLGVSYLLLACLWAPLMLLIFALSRWLQLGEKSHVG